MEELSQKLSLLLWEKLEILVVSYATLLKYSGRFFWIPLFDKFIP